MEWSNLSFSAQKLIEALRPQEESNPLLRLRPDNRIPPEHMSPHACTWQKSLAHLMHLRERQIGIVGTVLLHGCSGFSRQETMVMIVMIPTFISALLGKQGNSFLLFFVRPCESFAKICRKCAGNIQDVSIQSEIQDLEPALLC